MLIRKVHERKKKAKAVDRIEEDEEKREWR